RHVIADLGGLPDNNAHAEVNKKTPTDLRPRVDLDPGQPAIELGNHARAPLPVTHPQPVGGPMQPDGMKPRIARDHLEGITRRRIATENALDILSHPLEHHRSLRLWGSPRAAF